MEIFKEWVHNSLTCRPVNEFIHSISLHKIMKMRAWINKARAPTLSAELTTSSHIITRSLEIHTLTPSTHSHAPVKSSLNYCNYLSVCERAIFVLSVCEGDISAVFKVQIRERKGLGVKGRTVYKMPEEISSEAAR